MRNLAIFGVALLSAAAFLGTGVGCGSDAVSGNKGGSKNTAGSKAKGGTNTQTQNTNEGGSDEPNTTDEERGGSSNKGGSDDTGGSDGEGGSGPDTSTPSGGDSIVLTDGLYQSGSYSGYLWTAHDTPTEAPAEEGSVINPPCGDSGDCFSTSACVTGYTAAIPKLASGDLDYSGVWGVSVGWNLAEEENGTVDVSGMQSITVGIAGAKIPTTLRVQMDVPPADDPSGTSTTYCATLTLPNGKGNVKLTSLKTECWSTAGTAFDPATMKPKNISVQAVASKTKGDFDFCISALSIDE